MSEHAVSIDLPGLEWSAGAPEPFLVSTEHRSLFAFYPPDTTAADRDLVRVAEFVACTSVRFGFPNDEVLGGHRLYGRGLTFYAAHEVRESTWLEEFRTIERTHPRTPTTPFADSRHWILTFHDTTLEAIAVGIELRGDFPDRATAVAAMVAQLSLV
jgi:hypothetical protein